MHCFCEKKLFSPSKIRNPNVLARKEPFLEGKSFCSSVSLHACTKQLLPLLASFHAILIQLHIELLYLQPTARVLSDLAAVFMFYKIVYSTMLLLV